MIRVNAVTKTFEDFKALSDVTCNIADGCIYGMVGSNGAGKSTFLRILTGVYKPDKGEVLIDDEPLYDNPKVKENMVYVADELFFLTGANMEKMAQLYAVVYDNFSYERFHELAAKFKLDTKRNIGTFSKGMKRQAAIILALSTRAQYLFFDETFDGLDPVMRNLVKNLIYQDVCENNATAIITSHSLRELEDICDHLALLHKGGLVLDSDIIDLKTSQFKVQVAFDHAFDKSKFQGIHITRYRQEASVANMIINGDYDSTIAYLKAMEPKIMDILPLTLEEVFTYEMESLGYQFDIETEENTSEQEKDRI